MNEKRLSTKDWSQYGTCYTVGDAAAQLMAAPHALAVCSLLAAENFVDRAANDKQFLVFLQTCARVAMSIANHGAIEREEIGKAIGDTTYRYHEGNKDWSRELHLQFFMKLTADDLK